MNAVRWIVLEAATAYYSGGGPLMTLTISLDGIATSRRDPQQSVANPLLTPSQALPQVVSDMRLRACLRPGLEQPFLRHFGVLIGLGDVREDSPATV